MGGGAVVEYCIPVASVESNKIWRCRLRHTNTFCTDTPPPQTHAHKTHKTHKRQFCSATRLARRSRLARVDPSATASGCEEAEETSDQHTHTHIRKDTLKKKKKEIPNHPHRQRQ